MNISDAKKNLKQILTTDGLSVVLWSAPGIGKSSICKQIAEELGWKFIDVRLAMLMASDLQGIPYPDQNHEKTNWLIPSFFPPQDSKDFYLILFDEISNAPISVQHAAYRLILDKEVNDSYKFPPNAKIVAAGNREEDNCGVQRFSNALANRFIHFNIEEDFESWKLWALRNKINDKVIGFLNWKPNMLYKAPKIEAKAFPTPRTWEMVSDLLNSGIDDDEVLGGTVGEGTASEFITYMEVYTKLPDIKKILSGKSFEVPKEMSVLYALSSSLVSHAAKDNIDNIFKYCEKLPQEMHLLTIRDIIRQDEDVANDSLKLDAWIGKYGELFTND